MDRPVPTEVFSDLSTSLFEQTGKQEWRENPRLFFILRQLGREDLFQEFLDNHVTDLWLPIPKYVLLNVLKDEKDKVAFLDAQELCLDDRMPATLIGQHLSLRDSNCLQLEEKKPLGSGRYGEVHHVVQRQTGIAYARKTMLRPMNFIRHRDLMKLFKRELSGMRRVRHPHCVSLMATCTDTDSVIFLSSPVADMDLAKFLDADLNSRQLDTLCRSVGCITSALCYLHQLNIRHNDLKPNNILIQGSNILLTDFGFCLDFSDSSISTTTGPPTHYTRRYAAPEAIDHEPRNRLTDIWGLGCVLFEILSRLYGYKLSEMNEFWRTKNNGYNSFARNPHATASWVRMITGSEETQQGHSRRRLWLISFVYHVLLQQDRLLRPTAKQVLERLEDSDAAYPVNASQSWVGTCCTSQSDLSTSRITFQGSVPQWPILDLMIADSRLAYVFLDVDFEMLAVSRNLSFLDDMKGSGLQKLRHLFPAGPYTDVLSELHSISNSIHAKIRSPLESNTGLDHIMNSIFTTRLQDTEFRVAFSNVILEDDKIPRIRTVQISRHRMAMERQPGYGNTFIVITFHPEEGGVTRYFDPEQGQMADFSYREGRDVWTDGLSITPTLFGEEKSQRYATLAAQVSQRRKNFEKLLNKRRIITKGFSHSKCFRCKRMGFPCNGPQAGGCDQCKETSSRCVFSAEAIERGGESTRYIDSKEYVEELITRRWGS